MIEEPAPSLGALRAAIAAAWRLPEPECLPPLLERARLGPAGAEATEILARRLVQGLRSARPGTGGVDALLREFSISSQEGVALMCLAEALLRIPDPATADALIRDKLRHGHWEEHLGHSPHLFVNAAAWGLMLTGRLLELDKAPGNSLKTSLGRILAKGGEPLIRAGMDLAMRLLGERFVAGHTIEEALERGRRRERQGYRHSFDMLGEAAMTAADAKAYFAAYEAAIHAVGREAALSGPRRGNGISIKLSALHPRYSWSQMARVQAELAPRLADLCRLACHYDIGVNIDAEESDRLEPSLDLLEGLARDPALAGWSGLGFVVQAYQKRAPAVIAWLVQLARETRRPLMVRLVKGAYWDAEIKRAQVAGLTDYPVYTRKAYTDVAYLACARQMLAARQWIYPQFATHNAHTVSAISAMAGSGGGGEYEFQCLHGMGEGLYDQLLAPDPGGVACRIYAPVGSHRTLLPYLVRRLLESGANTSLVFRVLDESIKPDELLADPVAEAAFLGGQPHPFIPLPPALYEPLRANAMGLDLADEAVRAMLRSALAASRRRSYVAAPQIPGGPIPSPPREVTNPANRDERVGAVMDALPAHVDLALACATASAPEWAATPVRERAACLDRAAEALEREAPEFMALLVREAGKTWLAALGEVREAIDDCRYYAARARIDWTGGGPGGRKPGGGEAGGPDLSRCCPDGRSPPCLWNSPGRSAVPAGPRCNGGHGLGGRHPDPGRAVHGFNGRGARHPPDAGGPGRHSARGGDGRAERHDRRFLGLARTGGRRRLGLRLRFSRPALFGPARPVSAGGHCRPGAPHAAGRHGGAQGRASGGLRLRRGAPHRCGCLGIGGIPLRWHGGSGPRNPARGAEYLLQSGELSGPHAAPDSFHRRARAGSLRSRPAYLALPSRATAAGAGRSGAHRLRTHPGHPDPYRRDRHGHRWPCAGGEHLREPQHDRRGGGCPALWRRRAFGHRPQGGRPVLLGAPRARRRAAPAAGRAPAASSVSRGLGPLARGRWRGGRRFGTFGDDSPPGPRQRLPKRHLGRPVPNPPQSHRRDRSLVPPAARPCALSGPHARVLAQPDRRRPCNGQSRPAG